MDTIEAIRKDADLSAEDVIGSDVENAPSVSISAYWSGERAPAGRHAIARVIWTPRSLCIRFDCRQDELLVAADSPRTDVKTMGLWERDVCEIFIAPDPTGPRRYLEFEAAPTGEWLDLAVLFNDGELERDWDYESGMTTASHIGEASVTIAMRIPWEAFGKTPVAGERWRVNLFRCVGSGEGRGYLSWQATNTERPNFHLPDAFGWLEFR